MKYEKRKFSKKILIQFIFIIISLISALFIINGLHKKFNSVILPLAISEAKSNITVIINNSTKNVMIDNKLFELDKIENNRISTVTYDSNRATLLVNLITDNIQSKFDILFKDNYIVTKIPFGVLFNNGVMRSFGPMINVKLKIIGNVISELQTEVKPYGLNNALVLVKVKIIVNAMVILPLTSKNINVTNVVPLSINIVNGNVPQGYISSYK